MERAVGRHCAQHFANGLNSALLCRFRALDHQRRSAHAHDHAVPPPVERSRSILDHIVGRCRSAGQKACAHPLHQMIGSDVVSRDDNHAVAAPGTDPVLRQRYGLRGARARGVDLRVGSPGANEFGKLRMAHGKSFKQESPIENIRLFFNRGAQLLDAAVQLLRHIGMTIRFDHPCEQALQSGQLIAAGMIRVVAGHFIRERIVTGKCRCEDHTGVVAQSVRQPPAIRQLRPFGGCLVAHDQRDTGVS